jgi:hypothetical protein
MITEYDNLKVSSPAPGHYIIEGLPAGSTQTEEGRLVHPMSVHIPPSFPSGLLMEIVKDRASKTDGLTVEKLQAAQGILEVAEIEDGVKGSERNGAVDAIVDHLSANGATRIRDLANAVGLDVDTIKTLDGQGFELGNAGWVKLKEGGEA